MNTPQNTFPTLPESELEEFKRLSPQEQIERLNTDITSRLNRIKEHELRERHHKNLITSTQQECIGLYALINGIQNEITTKNLVTSNDKPAEPVFKGWITNRPPTLHNSTQNGNVGIYNELNMEKWDYEEWEEVASKGIPWISFRDVSQFTSSNPAPSPYTQEVSA